MKIEIDEKWTCEYDKASIRKLEEQGFNFKELENKPFTLLSVMFYGSLLKNHPNITTAEADKIYDEYGDQELMKEIDTMFVEAAKVGDKKNPNAKWKKMS